MRFPERMLQMLHDKMEKALNEQVNAEMFSAYLYLAMGAYLESIGLRGGAIWMNAQAQEEMVHAMKIYNFVMDRSGRAKLLAIDAPQFEWKSMLDAFEAAYKHEVYITGRINDLMNLAHELKDHATAEMLNWFVKEQIEEEAQTSEIVQKLKLVENTPGGVFLIDKDLGTRIPLYTMPPTAM